MQVGVIGGICLLACLLSIGHTEELGDSKQSEESETDQKELEGSIEKDFRRFNNDVKSYKELSSDLKTDDNVTELGSKSSTDVRNVSQNAGDSSTSKESFQNRTAPDSLAPFKPPALPEPISPKSSTYFMDSHFTIDESLPEGQLQAVGNNKGPDANPYFNGLPYVHQGFVTGSQPSSISSPSRSAPNLPLITNLNNIGREAVSRLDFTTVRQQEEITTNRAIERSLVLNTNRVYTKLPISDPNVAQGQLGSKFSPLFSSDYAHKPSSEYIDPLYQPSNNVRENTLPKSLAFSIESAASFGETRREGENEDIQERNVDESQYSETMNAYPYTPPADSSSENLRSGAPNENSYPSYPNSVSASAQAYASAQVQTIDDLSAHNQGLNPYSYGYPPRPPSSPGSLASAIAAAQASNLAANAQSSAGATNISDAKSRIIWPHEYIFPHKIPGGENIIQCSRENELHHFWSKTFDCLICICLNEYGVLEPVCASCSGCRNPAPPEPPPNIEPTPSTEPQSPLRIPDPYLPIPIPTFEPFTPSASAPSLIAEPDLELGLELTTAEPVREGPVNCSPLPSGQLFKHPLNPCQLCMCKEFINTVGKNDVRIECQDSAQCVIPPETSTLPPMPDKPVPVPLPLCEKFPAQVLFPHPKESCKKCKCSVEQSDLGVPEQKITCFPDTTDSNCVSSQKPDSSTELATPPAPPIPIPVEPYPGPFPQPGVEQVPDQFPPPPSPNAVTPKEPLPWPPVSTPPTPPKPFLPKKGPLPGPSPHESCRPYPPNQPFQHPWDDCQICECSEIKTIGMVNVEISCYTKLSCCIESPEHVISAVAGKSISKASGGPHGEDGKAIALVNEVLSGSTFRPPTYGSGILNASGNKEIYHLPYQTPSMISNSISATQTSGETSFEYKPASSFMPGISLNQGYVDTNSGAQNTINKPTYSVPDTYPSVNGYGSVNSGSPSSGETNSEYNIVPTGTNNPPSSSLKSITPGGAQNQPYPESSIVQKPLNGPTYQVSGNYQPGKPGMSGVNNGGLSSEASEDYSPISVTYKPPLIYPQYPGMQQSQAYAEANAQYNRPSSTFKPPALYGQYNPDISPNQAYAEALAQYNDLMASTQKPPALYGQYNLGIAQSQAYANAQYNNFVTSTFKPPALYTPYGPEGYPSQAYAQANTQYRELVTSTPRPAALYGQYNAAASPNLIYPTANAVYTGPPTATEKPASLYNPYTSSIPQNQAYGGSTAQSSIQSPGYYLGGQYQKAKLAGSGSGTDQSSAVAEASAQSQDYSPYSIQPGSQVGSNIGSNLAYPYQSNYYKGLLSQQQFSAYPARTNKGFDGYNKPSQIQYAGNYDFNGQADSISILSPQGYYPYGSGYSQTKPGTTMYSALIPSQSSYDVASLYRPGQYGGSNAQTVAQAYAATQTRSKSGSPEDSEDSK